jgi:hypothetical protein
MADVKISALPASTTPLAGTEVLPIVQSGTTSQVSVANLTAGRSFNALGMTLTSTDAGATAAPLLDLYRDSASPAVADTLGEIEFNGEDSAGNKQTYGVIHGSILSPTSGTEQGQLHFETATAGALTEKMIIGTTNLVINEIGGVFNVRIEGDTDANLFYTDATNSRVGIGLITPAEKLDVLGSAKVSGKVTAQTLTIGLGGQTSVATNTALGFEALNSASLTGTENTGVGYLALTANTTGSNSAFGSYALYSNTTGSGNSAMGQAALALNTTGNNNSAVGQNALFSNTTASSNSALGRSALEYYNTANNTAVGFEAARGSATVANNTGANLTAVGYQALTANTSGSDNTAVGDQTGDVITTGARNTIIGANSDPSAAAGIDQTVVGEGLTGKGDDTAFIGGTNGAYNEKNVTTWETTSDQRIKKNIVSNNVGLEVISQIDVRNFEYRTAEEITDLPSSAAIDQSGTQLGVIAQELQAVLPECVTENSTGVLSVNTDPLIWYLINAVKQLSAKIAELEGA